MNTGKLLMSVAAGAGKFIIKNKNNIIGVLISGAATGIFVHAADVAHEEKATTKAFKQGMNEASKLFEEKIKVLKQDFENKEKDLLKQIVQQEELTNEIFEAYKDALEKLVYEFEKEISLLASKPNRTKEETEELTELVNISAEYKRKQYIPGNVNEIYFVIGNIAELNIECIVNAANKTLLGGGGVDGAIHKAAGKDLLEECKTLNGCNTGEAKITKGYNLPANYVIHTVGPVYSGKEDDAEKLASCYRESLELARANGIHSIAFPSISTGAYKYPVKDASAVALNAISSWVKENIDYDMMVVICSYDERTYLSYRDNYRQLG